MKRLTMLLFLGLMAFSHVFAQSCLPDGITLRNQSDVDNFPINNPGCTVIEGDLTIGYDGYVTDIANLNGLSAVTEVQGTMHINTNENLSDFTGLNALATVGGNLIIENNDGITDMSGFDALASIDGDLYVVENSNLLSFNGMGALTTINGMLEMGHNLLFEEFTGLSGLTFVGGIEMNYLHEMTSMTGFTSLTQIDGNLKYNSCHGIINLSGLNLVETITGDVMISSAQSLESLTGFEGLTSIGGSFYIWDNDELTEVTALSNLTQIGGMLDIGGNALLASLAGLEGLTTLGTDLDIGGNSVLTSLAGIDNINPQSITNLIIEYNPILSICEVQSICEYLLSPGGMVTIWNNSTGCMSEEEVKGACGTGIDDILEQAFTIYPNPATDNISIRSNANFSIEKVVIYDQMGREAMVPDHSQGAIDISTLSNGIYIIGIKSEKGDTRALFVKE